MKALALIISLLIVAIGVVGILAPEGLLRIGQWSVTSTGLYVIAAFRVGIGLVLLGVASASRTPRTLRVFGVFVLVAGLATPLFGVARAGAVLNWWLAQDPLLLRLLAALLVAFGAFLLYVVAAGRRAA